MKRKKEHIDYLEDDNAYSTHRQARERTVKCPECGRTCLAEDDYCDDCGALLDVSAIEEELEDGLFVEEYDADGNIQEWSDSEEDMKELGLNTDEE